MQVPGLMPRTGCTSTAGIVVRFMMTCGSSAVRPALLRHLFDFFAFHLFRLFQSIVFGQEGRGPARGHHVAADHSHWHQAQRSKQSGGRLVRRRRRSLHLRWFGPALVLQPGGELAMWHRAATELCPVCKQLSSIRYVTVVHIYYI